ncbi:MAG TPA: hypothetical protein DCW35_01380 [Polynucleobacter sp.]|nr:hypothetical protein [Polynucleobacter sp.]
MEMPARHIASHSFDEILSDLGDDPANPDPYGIRKSPQQNKGPSKPQNPSNHTNFAQALNSLHSKIPLQKIGVFIPLLGIIALWTVGVL